MPAKKELPKPPEKLFAIASPHSLGGVSMFEAGAQINASTVGNFYSEQKLISSAVDKLKLAGFEILQISGTSINIAAPIDVYERAFNTKIHSEERPVVKMLGREDTATFWEAARAELPALITAKGTAFSDILEGIAIERPYYYMDPSMFAPTKAYWHLDVPAGVSLGCNADQAHRGGITGKDITVSMVDTGHYRHPFFVARGYRVAPVVVAPGAANPLADEVGHGTGESANIFSVAPDVQLLPVKANLVNATAAFNTAVGLNPTIITCSWGADIQFGPLDAASQAMAAAVAAAVAAGIVVVFSAGNGSFGFPGQHPDVISAGGVYIAADGSLTASDYASGFMSNIYPGRRVPDLSGLVGMVPFPAALIMLPVEAGDELDVECTAGGAFPNGDETANNDGWACFSGTSAAAPQLAGASALVKQACPRLTPSEVRDVLMTSARDVTTGNCAARVGGAAAVVGPDVATGNGLVDVQRAVLVAKIRCLGPIIPRRIIPPVVSPVEPVVKPIEPVVKPVQPVVKPIEPIREPSPEPVQPPAAPLAEEAKPQGAPLTAEDIAALEAIVLQSGTGLG